MGQDLWGNAQARSVDRSTVPNYRCRHSAFNSRYFHLEFLAFVLVCNDVMYG